MMDDEWTEKISAELEAQAKGRREMKTRIYWTLLGAHVHTRWFTFPGGVGSYALNGELVFNEAEWKRISFALATREGFFELIEERRIDLLAKAGA